MPEIKEWMNRFETALDAAFPGRVKFLGLQGSRARGEAAETSDIDVVVLLDTLAPEDIDTYRRMLDTLPHRELVCGFLSGWEELLAWEPGDLFQFYHDTIPIRGSLEPVRSRLDPDGAVRAGACSLYHACVHNLTHERDPEMVQGLLKGAVFTIQAVHYRRTGEYLRRLPDLLAAEEGPERELLLLRQRAKAGEPIDWEEASRLLLTWTRGLILNQ